MFTWGSSLTLVGPQHDIGVSGIASRSPVATFRALARSFWGGGGGGIRRQLSELDAFLLHNHMASH